MSNTFNKVVKVQLLILRMMGMIVLQFIIASLRAKPDVMFVDTKIASALIGSSLILWSHYFISMGTLTGVAIQQNEEEFDILYSRYTDYFNNLYEILEERVRLTYTLSRMIECKVN